MVNKQTLPVSTIKIFFIVLLNTNMIVFCKLHSDDICFIMHLRLFFMIKIKDRIIKK